MKNQYVGDMGDFGKYSMLRAFSEAGIRIGVNWYLTEDDGSNDGKYISYLEDEKMRWRCPVVFDAMKGLANKKNKSVVGVQKSGILGEALFYAEMINAEGTSANRERQRTKWFSDSMDALKAADLIFMDPDNGLMEKGDATKLGAEKYIFPDEVEKYYNAGHNVVYYCHKGRRSIGDWQDYKSVMFNLIPTAKPAILTFHKGTQRSFIFVIHEESFKEYRRIIDGFMDKWHRLFSEEYTNKGNAAGEAMGAAFTFTTSYGANITIENRADGQLQIKNSSKPNITVVMTPDMVYRLLGL